MHMNAAKNQQKIPAHLKNYKFTIVTSAQPAVAEKPRDAEVMCLSRL